MGRFLSKDEIRVGDMTIRYSKACVATGAKSYVPDIKGLTDINYYTLETVFNMQSKPNTMAVIGNGTIAAELAQAYQRLGIMVTLIIKGARLLPSEDIDADQFVEKSLRRDGVTIYFETLVQRCLRASDPDDEGQEVIRLNLKKSRGEQQVQDHTFFNAVLVISGKRANTEGLGLESVGVDVDEEASILVNRHMTTSNRSIFAVGNCVAHTNWRVNSCESQARLIAKNAFLFSQSDWSTVVLNRSVHTDPQVSTYGDIEQQLRSENTEYDCYTKFYEVLDRAICDGQAGMLKILTKRGSA